MADFDVPGALAPRDSAPARSWVFPTRWLIAAGWAALVATFGVTALGNGSPKVGVRRAQGFVEAAVAAPQQPVFDALVQIRSPDGVPRARVFLFPGLRAGQEFWETAPFAEFVEQLLRDGNQVVIAGLPYAQASFWKDGGEAYCRQFGGWLAETLRQIEQVHGTVSRQIAAGVSYGGMHAMIAAATLPEVEGFAAVSPVTDVGALNEFWWLTNDQCNPAAFAAGLAKKPGFVAYQDRDHRVNGELTTTLIQNLRARGATLDVQRQDSRDHESTPAILERVATWIAQDKLARH